jgi:multisubunit Na+/H+ antiporter MnhB subunit
LYTINFWIAFCVGAGAVILFNIIMGKRLKKREAAYYRKHSGADKTK